MIGYIFNMNISTFHPDSIRFIEIDTENAVATADETKLALRIEHDADDALIEDIIVNAKSWVEECLSRKLDDASYDIVFNFPHRTIRPIDYDRLWLSVAPINAISFAGDSILSKLISTANGFDKYIEWDQELFNSKERPILRVSTSCEAWIVKAIKIPFFTVCAEMYRYREMTIRPGAVNNVIIAALNPYKREV